MLWFSDTPKKKLHTVGKLQPVIDLSYCTTLRRITLASLRFYKSWYIWKYFLLITAFNFGREKKMHQPEFTPT